MSVLVSVRRHVGAHPDGHQHGVSVQISINFVKTFLRISRIRNFLLTWILARVFAYLPPFISRILELIYWTVLIFILIYFEWCDTENQYYYLIKRVTCQEEVDLMTWRVNCASNDKLTCCNNYYVITMSELTKDCQIY